jgi:flagellar basal body P-ring protein FlgI
VFGTVQDEKPGKPSTAADSLNARLKAEEVVESASIKEDIEERFSKENINLALERIGFSVMPIKVDELNAVYEACEAIERGE